MNENENTKRYATVMGRSDPSELEAYLPANYRLIGGDAESGWIIEGEDDAGWTLDEYVIPRLASGLLACVEVTAAEVDEILGPVVAWRILCVGQNGQVGLGEDEPDEVLARDGFMALNAYCDRMGFGGYVRAESDEEYGDILNHGDEIPAHFSEAHGAWTGTFTNYEIGAFPVRHLVADFDVTGMGEAAASNLAGYVQVQAEEPNDDDPEEQQYSGVPLEIRFVPEFSPEPKQGPPSGLEALDALLSHGAEELQAGDGCFGVLTSEQHLALIELRDSLRNSDPQVDREEVLAKVDAIIEPEPQPRTILVHLNVEAHPSDVRNADEIGDFVLGCVEQGVYGAVTKGQRGHGSLASGDTLTVNGLVICAPLVEEV
jgi:hypothetical protein